MGTRSQDGTTHRMWRQQVPSMGRGSVAYRLLERHETANGFAKTRQFHIAVLRGRYLVNIFNQARTFQPDTDNGVRLARMTLANIG